MAYVPRAALSGILLYIALLYTALRVFRLNEMIQIYHDSGPEVLLVAASAALVIALPIETGILLAIVLSFVHSLYIVARPYCLGLARVPGSTVWWPPQAASGRPEAQQHEQNAQIDHDPHAHAGRQHRGRGCKLRGLASSSEVMASRRLAISDATPRAS